ncbi:hypothetical protein [Aliikangiella sp. IMCC44359]|uniref:hypothetical protein n=1 Tax=Aliikangiella sp. IMCC44359 TaxID=3459125 RepID=UPI00403ADE88
MKRLQVQGFEISKNNIKIQFVGLYDTVASEGLAHWNDTHSLKLDAIGRSEVKKVIHLVAVGWYRPDQIRIESPAGM